MHSIVNIARAMNNKQAKVVTACRILLKGRERSEDDRKIQ